VAATPSLVVPGVALPVADVPPPVRDPRSSARGHSPRRPRRPLRARHDAHRRRAGHRDRPRARL